MRSFKKTLLAMLLLVIISMIPASVTQAAKKPGKVEGLSAISVLENSVTLRWSSSKNTTGYYIYGGNGTSMKQVGTTTYTSYKVPNLAINTKYDFQVFSYRKKGGKIYRAAAGSNIVSATTKAVKPSAVPGFKIASIGDRCVNLEWSMASGCDGYNIYAYNDNTKEFVKVASTGSTAATINSLSAGKTYRFKIAAYHTYAGETMVGPESAEVSCVAKKVDMANVLGRSYSATMKADVTGTIVGSNRTMVVKKGTKVTATDGSKKTCTVILGNGTKVVVPRSKVNYGRIKWTTKYFTKDQAETFINTKGYTSKTNYLIWISQYTSAVYIFKGSKNHWKLERSMPAVIGAQGTATPMGQYVLTKRAYKYGDKILYVKYYGGVVGGWGFHKRVSSLARGWASHGCIRLGVSDLHYMADHCKRNTRVLSY